MFSYISPPILPGWVQSAQTDSMGQTAGLLNWPLLDSSSTWLYHFHVHRSPAPSLDSGKHLVSLPGFLSVAQGGRWREKAQWLGKTCLFPPGVWPSCTCSRASGRSLPHILCLVIYWHPEQGGHCVQPLVPPCSSPCHLPGTQWFSCSLVSGPRAASLFCLTWPT